MPRKSTAERLDDLHYCAQAAALFEALAEQASAVASREWWTFGAGSAGAFHAMVSRDAERVAALAEGLREKYHQRCVDAAEALQAVADKKGRAP